MGLKERLDSYDLLAIALLIVGTIMFLASRITYYVIITSNQMPEDYFMELNTFLGTSAILIFGLGLFLSFRKIYKNLELPRHFPFINYTYLIFLLPQLFIILSYLFLEEVQPFGISTPDWINNFYIAVPVIRRILLAMMFIFIFIAIVKRERSKEAYSGQEQSTKDELE
ncbi:MAG: hypothetical protein ACQESD_02020 [Thermoplasmatota archaeon]